MPCPPHGGSGTLAGVSSFPFALAFAVLWCAAMARGQATYWIARTVTEQTLRRTRPTAGWRARVHRWLASDAMVTAVPRLAKLQGVRVLVDMKAVRRR